MTTFLIHFLGLVVIFALLITTWALVEEALCASLDDEGDDTL